MSRIDEIKERVAKATEGPWTCDKKHKLGEFIYCSKGYLITGPVNKRPAGKANSDFIAHSRADVEYLCREYDTMKAEISRLTEKVKALQEIVDNNEKN